MNKWKNETALVNAIVKEIRKHYPYAYILKIHGGPMQQPGIPDLLICIDGMFIGQEVKHQKPTETEAHARGRATPLQKIHLQKILASGGMAGVVLTPQESLDMIDRARTKFKEIHNAR